MECCISPLFNVPERMLRAERTLGGRRLDEVPLCSPGRSGAPHPRRGRGCKQDGRECAVGNFSSIHGVPSSKSRWERNLYGLT